MVLLKRESNTTKLITTVIFTRRMADSSSKRLAYKATRGNPLFVLFLLNLGAPDVTTKGWRWKRRQPRCSSL